MQYFSGTYLLLVNDNNSKFVNSPQFILYKIYLNTYLNFQIYKDQYLRIFQTIKGIIQILNYYFMHKQFNLL